MTELQPAGPVFESREFTVRGQTYTIKELSSAEYDKLYKAAELADGEIDTQMLLRLMALKSIEPEMSSETLGSMPMRVTRAILREVNDLHFGEEDATASPKND